jgi:hypothetical protein
LSQNSDYDDLSYFWTSEKDKWFLVRHIRGEHNFYSIHKMEGKEILMLSMRDGDDTYWYIESKMLENGCRIITEEEYLALLPKRTLWQRLGNQLFLYYQRIGMSIANFILRHKTLENFVLWMLEHSQRRNQF